MVAWNTSVQILEECVLNCSKFYFVYEVTASREMECLITEKKDI